MLALERFWLFQANGFLLVEIHEGRVLCCRKAWLTQGPGFSRPMVFFVIEIHEVWVLFCKRPGWKRNLAVTSQWFSFDGNTGVWILYCKRAWLKKGMAVPGQWFSCNWNQGSLSSLCCRKGMAEKGPGCSRPMVSFQLKLIMFEFCVVKRLGWKRAWLFQANGFLLIEINEVWVCVVERPGWKRAWLFQANGFLLIELNEVWVRVVKGPGWNKGPGCSRPMVFF